VASLEAIFTKAIRDGKLESNPANGRRIKPIVPLGISSSVRKDFLGTGKEKGPVQDLSPNESR
jgi:hypothetical protein